MSIIGSNILAGAAGSGVSAYEIEQSLRFRGGSTQYLYRTGAITAQGGVSLWVKFHRDVGSFTAGVIDSLIYLSGEGPHLYRNPYGYLYYRSISSGGDTTWSAQRARDHSAWYHIFLKFNSSNSTSLYVNNVSWGTQTSSTIGTSNAAQRVGYSGSYYAQYNLAEYHAAFGESLDPTDFGEYDSNGVWVPKKFTGSYGSQGFYLKFDPSAANGLGHDHSGNGNHFTNAGGFTTSGTGTDVMSDTPTNNHCTWNPLSKGSNSPAPTNGNLRGGLPGAQNGTFAVSSGKWYWETKYISGNGYAIATGVGAVDLAQPAAGFSTGIIYYGGTGGTYGNDMGLYNFSGSPDTSYGTGGFWTGGHFGVMLDLDSSPQTIAFSKDGTTYSTVNIPSDKQGLTYVPLVQGGSSSTTGSWDLFVDENTWTYTPPTGFKALNTSNLPAPENADGSEYFNTLLYTGDGTAPRSLTGVGLQPDWVWIKARDQAWWHVLGDSVRGSNGVNGLNLNTNDTAFEGDENSGHVESWDSDGFTVDEADSGANPLVNVNNNGSPYVAWNWKAGGTASSNTAGSITSTVSANPSAGFSIVSYQSQTATKPITLGHGLGVKPSMIICKNRDAASAWTVYHSALGATKAVFLNSTLAAATSADYWNDTEPTSTVFTVNDSTGTHAYGTSNDMIAYCFAEVEGYSKFSSYTGNGSSDGPFIYTGFRPAFILVKANGTADWWIEDTSRDTYNPADTFLQPNRADAESSVSASTVDILSNGFKHRGFNTGSFNKSGDTYIYAAFAENPFGGDGVSPATAR